MPVKKRTPKNHSFNEHHRQMLLHGPDSMLLAGCGYLAIGMLKSFRSATPSEQSAVIAAMRADWHRLGAKIIAEGNSDTWARTHFGEIK